MNEQPKIKLNAEQKIAIAEASIEFLNEFLDYLQNCDGAELLDAISDSQQGKYRKKLIENFIFVQKDNPNSAR